MKLIFYIGHHKVGSTALQVYLAQNWKRLIEAGILYPAVEPRGLVANLARGLGRTEDGSVNWDMNVREPHSALAYRLMSEVSGRHVPPQFRPLPHSSQMLHAIKMQIKTLAPHTVILCSEAFSNFGQVAPELIDTLATAFPEAEIEVYCTLRRIDDYLVSWHGQRIKVGEKVGALSAGGVKGYLDTIHFNYRLVVDAWRERLPRARLMLRPYADVVKAGGSTADFEAQVSVDFPAGMIPAGRENQSLPRAAMEIARRANHALAPEEAQKLRRVLLRTAPPVANADVEMLGEKLRRDVATRFAPIHDWLGQVSGRSPFFEDIDAVLAPAPVPEAEAAAACLAALDIDALPGDETRTFIRNMRRGNAA